MAKELFIKILYTYEIIEDLCLIRAVIWVKRGTNQTQLKHEPNTTQVETLN